MEIEIVDTVEMPKGAYKVIMSAWEVRVVCDDNAKNLVFKTSTGIRGTSYGTMYVDQFGKGIVKLN